MSKAITFTGGDVRLGFSSSARLMYPLVSVIFTATAVLLVGRGEWVGGVPISLVAVHCLWVSIRVQGAYVRVSNGVLFVSNPYFWKRSVDLNDLGELVVSKGVLRLRGTKSGRVVVIREYWMRPDDWRVLATTYWS